MRVKSVVLFVLAIGCGLVAMVGVQQALSRPEADPDANTVVVYVAKEEIQAGMRVDESKLQKVRVPKTGAPSDVVTDAKDFEERPLLAKVFPGDYIRVSKLGEKGRLGASITIPKGMRVFTVPVTATSSHSGMIQPKDRVDILVTYSNNGPQSQVKRTKLVLDYVEVFAVDNTRDLENSESNKGAAAKNITFLVTPKENIRLSLAEKKGELQISLRNPDDKEKSTIDVFDEKDLNEAKLERSEPQVTDGSYQPENPTPPTPVTAPLEDFLKEVQGQPAPVPASLPVNKKTWTISIFEKDQRRDAVIEEAPDELAALTGQGAAGGLETPTGQPSLLDNVRDLFKKPSRKPAPVQQNR